MTEVFVFLLHLFIGVPTMALIVGVALKRIIVPDFVTMILLLTPGVSFLIFLDWMNKEVKNITEKPHDNPEGK